MPQRARAAASAPSGLGSLRDQLLSALTNEHEIGARRLLADLCAAADPSVLSNRHVDALEIEFTRLATLASQDELTGLYNRRAFIGMGTRVLDLAARLHLAPVLIYCDVDALKQVNDSAGHTAGDDLIRRAGVALRAAFRDTDLVARVGGDEFAALVGMDFSLGGRPILKRVRRALADANRDAPRFPIALSIGVATFDPEQPVALDALLASADSSMYRRKRATRRQAG